MATHSGILAWRIPWSGEPGRLQSMGLQRVWTRLSNFIYCGNNKPKTYNRYTHKKKYIITLKKVINSKGKENKRRKDERMAKTIRKMNKVELSRYQ